MNKNDLIGVVADTASLTKAQAGEAVDAVFDAVTKSLTKGEEVRLVGFGTFSVSKRKATERDYQVLADLNFRPRTTYTAGVINPNPELA